MTTDPTEVIYAFAIAVMAIQLIYRVAERMIEALSDLDDEQDRE